MENVGALANSFAFCLAVYATLASVTAGCAAMSSDSERRACRLFGLFLVTVASGILITR